MMHRWKWNDSLIIKNMVYKIYFFLSMLGISLLSAFSTITFKFINTKNFVEKHIAKVVFNSEVSII